MSWGPIQGHTTLCEHVWHVAQFSVQSKQVLDPWVPPPSSGNTSFFTELCTADYKAHFPVRSKRGLDPGTQFYGRLTFWPSPDWAKLGQDPQGARDPHPMLSKTLLLLQASGSHALQDDVVTTGFVLPCSPKRACYYKLNVVAMFSKTTYATILCKVLVILQASCRHPLRDHFVTNNSMLTCSPRPFVTANFNCHVLQDRAFILCEISLLLQASDCHVL